MTAWVSWYCRCGRSCDGPVHENSEPHLRQAWEHVHSGPGHEAISFEEWDVVRAQEEAGLEDLLRDYGLPSTPASAIADLVWGGPRTRSLPMPPGARLVMTSPRPPGGDR